jgi:hypothetical protein
MGFFGNRSTNSPTNGVITIEETVWSSATKVVLKADPVTE